jgi:hypothetical protein
MGRPVKHRFEGLKSVGQAGGKLCLQGGENVFEYPDFGTGSCGGKSQGLTVQVLLQPYINWVVFCIPLLVLKQ